MADTLRVQSGGQDLSPSSTSQQSVRFDLDERADVHPLVGSMLISAVCMLAMFVIADRGWSVTDDGASVVPVVALIGIATATLSRRPDPLSRAVRVGSARLGILVFATSTVLVVVIAFDPDPRNLMLGPMISLATVGTYLAAWGFRTLALLRTVTLLSLLTWSPIAEAVHDIVRSSLDQPSELIYQRLARLPLFDVATEPWTLFTASLHRGSLVIIATVVLGVGAVRWRASVRSLVDLVLATTTALIVHHVVILSSDIDQYSPTDATEVVTDPILEIGIATIAVTAMALLRKLGDRRSIDEAERASQTARAHERSELEAERTSDRDPVIFATHRPTTHPVVAVLLVSGVAPLVAIAIVG